MSDMSYPSTVRIVSERFISLNKALKATKEIITEVPLIISSLYGMSAQLKQ